MVAMSRLAHVPMNHSAHHRRFVVELAQVPLVVQRAEFVAEILSQRVTSLVHAVLLSPTGLTLAVPLDTIWASQVCVSNRDYLLQIVGLGNKPTILM